MLRLVSDENFNGDIVRGLLLRQPALDLYRVQDVGLEEADDPTILAWAAANNRIVVTHDQATMPEQHRKVILAAEKAGKDMAEWVTETLEQAIGSTGYDEVHA
jgi:hypothetical protein